MKIVQEPKSIYTTDPVVVPCGNLRCNAKLEVTPEDVLYITSGYMVQTALHFRCPCCKYVFRRPWNNFSWDIDTLDKPVKTQTIYTGPK